MPEFKPKKTAIFMTAVQIGDPNSMIIEKVTNELIAYSKEKKPPV